MSPRSVRTWSESRRRVTRSGKVLGCPRRTRGEFPPSVPDRKHRRGCPRLGGAGDRTPSLMAKAPSTVRATPDELEAVALAAGPQKSVAKNSPHRCIPVMYRPAQ